MGKTENFAVGILLGAAVGAAVAYLFGPARNTTYDASYQSRWDRALAEGKQAELEHKRALEQKFVEAKVRNTPGQAALNSPDTPGA